MFECNKTFPPIDLLLRGQSRMKFDVWQTHSGLFSVLEFVGTYWNDSWYMTNVTHNSFLCIYFYF